LKHFPSTTQLLIEGQEPRLKLNTHGYNHYFCRPQVTPDLRRFGSSTATSISADDFTIAEQFRQQMTDDLRHQSMTELCLYHTQHIRQEICETCQLDASTTVLLSESGTFAHRQAIHLLCEPQPDASWMVIMVAACETGRGVPKALSPDNYDIDCQNIAIRQAGGEPRSQTAIENDLKAHVQQAKKSGQQVLIVLVDQSKSGFVTPSLECAIALRESNPECIHLMLDACQFRLSRESLRHYLQQNIMVAISGSKFLAGPSFSAALLLPHADQAERLATIAQPGLLLRWHIAITTLKQFHALDQQAIYHFLKTFHQVIHKRLKSDQHFTLLPTPNIHRPWSQVHDWDTLPTIVPFFFKRKEREISHTDALKIYQRMQTEEQPAQLGRPMSIQRQPTEEPSGLFRLSISAPMIIEAIQHQQQNRIIEEATQILDMLIEKHGI